jgi:hypothetical protein
MTSGGKVSKMGNMMKMKKHKPEREHRKEPYSPDDLRKVASDLHRMADKVADLASMMTRGGIDTFDVDGHYSLHERGFASILKFIANVQRELSGRNVF